MTAEIALKACELILERREAELYTLAGSFHPGGCALFFGDEAIFSDESLRALFLCAREAGIAHGEVASIDGHPILLERIGGMPRLYLCGGGHVAVCVARVAALTGFSVTVIDERTDFASRERFPSAERILNVPYAEGIDAVQRRERPYFVLVTRSHGDDETCLEHILPRPAAYVGMIGSGLKIRTIFSHLEEKGFTGEQLASVHAPIGLSIGAKTPEEIAVSIVAELIQVKNAPGGDAGWTEPFVQALQKHGARGAMCTLVGKRGSAPRGPGARLFVSTDGKLHGTVGGGYGEKAASDIALEAMRTGERGIYRLPMHDPGAAGTPDGGEIDVLIHPIL